MTIADPRGASDAQRFTQIDELRGIAAVLVIVMHAADAFAPFAARSGHGLALREVAFALDFGRIGVVLFFVISGFVVANSLGARGMTLAGFAIRRFFRLFPLFWVSVAAASLLATGTPPAARILANLTMIPAVLGFEPLIGLYWTLETELFFYVAAALLCATGFLFRPVALLAMIAALIAFFAALMFGILPAASRLEWQSMPLNLAFMLWGALLHGTRFSPPRATGDVTLRRWLPRVAAALVLAPSAFVFLRYFHSSSPDDLRWGISYPIALVLFWAWCAVRHTSTGLLSRLGLVSYSLYLSHALVVDLLLEVVDSGAIPGALASLPVLVVAAVVATSAASMVTYLAVEKPFIAAGRRIASGARRRVDRDAEI
jgi:peptidoglycan/LPS O-acetylase OafA/YrhL